MATLLSNRVAIIGAGIAGLGAAYALKKHGSAPMLFEAGDEVGGRCASEEIDGFRIDKGADFFCSSYDVVFRILQELRLPLVRSKMRLGWRRDGRWVTSTPGLSVGNLVRNLPAARALGFLSPGALWPAQKLFSELFRQSDEYLNFASDSRLIDLDADESFDEYLDRLGISERLKVTFRGFLEMTMGHVERSGQAYMRTYLSEMLLKADQLYVPEQGAGALSHGLAGACSDCIRLNTPVRRVIVGREGRVTGVVTDDGAIEADAVICAVPATKVRAIIPDLSDDMLQTLDGVVYSTGCRVVVGLDRSPLPPGWHGVLYPEDDTPLLLDRSINLPTCAPPGKSTLDLLVGRDRAKELIPLDDGEIKRRLLNDARRKPPPGSALPADDEGLFTRVYRWPEAVCMGAPGMFTAIADIRNRLRRDVGNLFLAGDYTRVPSVNGALGSGVEAAEEVARLLG